MLRGIQALQKAYLRWSLMDVDTPKCIGLRVDHRTPQRSFMCGFLWPPPYRVAMANDNVANRGRCSRVPIKYSGDSLVWHCKLKPCDGYRLSKCKNAENEEQRPMS